MNLRRHAYFYLAATIGLAVFLATAGQILALRMLLAGDVFSVGYVVLLWIFGQRTPDQLRDSGAIEDEGVALILILAGLAVALSLVAIFLVLNRPNASSLTLTLAIASVPLGWLMLHTMAASHYAHLYYAPPAKRSRTRQRGGLDFPGGGDPDLWDFLYFSFVIGMTAQVSDVAVQTPSLRRAVLLHGVASFFYNTVLLALTVNAAITLAS